MMSIDEICKLYDIRNYTINSDGYIDVNGHVYIKRLGLDKIPLNFNKVSGDFVCKRNKLTDLKGSPKEVGRDFNCQENKLISLEGSPKEVGRDFNCPENKLTSLADGPENIGNNLYCANNNIYNLKGLETKIKQYLTLDYNPIGILFGDLEGDIINSFISFKVINGRELNIKRLKYFLHTFGLDTSIHYDELKDKYTIKN